MSFRILIADDESLIRMDLKELLESIGHKVVAEASDGMEAFDLLNQTNPDLVILDIKMPRLSGLEMAKKISDKYPVIILTAFSEKFLIEQAKDAGVMAFLSKPFQEKSLSPAIELAVSHFLEKSILNERILHLKEELEVRKLVDRAKGILMDSENLSEAQAYRKIQKISMDKNKPIREIAEVIINRK